LLDSRHARYSLAFILSGSFSDTPVAFTGIIGAGALVVFFLTGGTTILSGELPSPLLKHSV